MYSLIHLNTECKREREEERERESVYLLSNCLDWKFSATATVPLSRKGVSRAEPELRPRDSGTGMWCGHCCTKLLIF